MPGVKQLVVTMDDDLHARLGARAAAEGRTQATVAAALGLPVQ
jgi:hypothetical protein